MTTFEFILAAICLACIGGPTVWCWLTPPKRSTYWAWSDLLADRLRREIRVARALNRLEGEER